MADFKPSIPSGTRDFSPEEAAMRAYIFDNIRDVFRLYGFLPIETPAMENLSTLLGKYGEEGDKLLYKILNSGNFAAGISDEEWEDYNKSSLRICEKGLRYDLTVPFARYVVQNRNSIVFPFRRYQIQPVWRADRPQKGRYREFYQCDADVIGSQALLNEAELIQLIMEVFTRLGIAVIIKLNNRKILAGIAGYIGEPDKITDFTVAIDKLEKIGAEKVLEELAGKGFSNQTIDKLLPLMNLKDDNMAMLDQLSGLLAGSETGQAGIEETKEILTMLQGMGANSHPVEFDLTLARGLNYYTGAIIEVKANQIEIGSICGGGRYDNLTGVFGMPGISGVGISFGADRIYDVMIQKGLFPKESIASTRVLFLNFGKVEALFCAGLAKKLRTRGISSEIYPDANKIKKQMAYANSRGVPWVVMAGEEEMVQHMVTLKNMLSGQQNLMTPDAMINKIEKG